VPEVLRVHRELVSVDLATCTVYGGYTVLLLDTVSMYFIGINMNLLIEKYWYWNTFKK